ncbi:STAS domain-containing protein [Kitasatospora sp. NBC_01302]|uniref:STAS domain-containing protein n=1 Tax=Kitasatospora sp. NBC_01302 TaxID=2903575 RepID=UPI002E165C1A|nr:STAS domain-containing protein [Kitasatospora sp. NBC_01302]
MAEQLRPSRSVLQWPAPVRKADGDPLLTVGLAVIGPVVRIDLSGDLDLDTSPQLAEAVAQALIHRPRVAIIDLSAVDFCDCAGLSALLRVARRVTGESAAFHLERPSAVVRRLLQLTGTGPVLGLAAAVEVVG